MKKYLFFIGVFSLFFLNSCLVSKKTVYLEDFKVDSAYQIAPMPALRIQKSDRLTIQVSSKSPELAVPFNRENGAYSVTEKGLVDVQNPVVVRSRGYLVDQDGNIEFPILGSIHLEGKTIVEVQEFIKQSLIEKKLINDPILTVELVNLRIMMMGETNTGILDVPEGKITLLEAINRSGGMSNNAKLDDVAVIREEHGIRKVYVNDLKSVDVYNSPTYYLQQNDVVLIKQKSAVMTPREQMTWRYIGMGTGLLTLILSMVAIFKN